MAKMVRPPIPKIPTNCEICSTEFLAPRYELWRGKGRFCSKRCSAQYKATLSILIAPQIQGEDHWAWTGGREATKKRQLQNYSRFRRRVRYVTHKAIREGKILRKPCEVCGSEKVQVHHRDYNDPMNIEWLCTKHHRQADIRDGTRTCDFGQIDSPQNKLPNRPPK